jgi:hypothetical protein
MSPLSKLKPLFSRKDKRSITAESKEVIAVDRDNPVIRTGSETSGPSTGNTSQNTSLKASERSEAGDINSTYDVVPPIPTSLDPSLPNTVPSPSKLHIDKALIDEHVSFKQANKTKYLQMTSKDATVIFPIANVAANITSNTETITSLVTTANLDAVHSSGSASYCKADYASIDSPTFDTALPPVADDPTGGKCGSHRSATYLLSIERIAENGRRFTLPRNGSSEIDTGKVDVSFGKSKYYKERYMLNIEGKSVSS